jgi:DNA polymerase-4
LRYADYWLAYRVPGGDPRCILFVDCDRFYFAVEAAERPGLADERRAVIIGRDPREAPRGIVTTANDPARAVGIHSGMPASTALRLAPDALFVPPRHHVYAQYSARVMAVLRDESPLVQQSSIDEAACAWPYGFIPEPPIALRERILNETGISVSLGLATSPLVAKMASEHAKKQPDHLWIVRPGEEAAFLAPLPIRALVGVGPKAEAKLLEAGIRTIGDLAAREMADVTALFGRAYGAYLWEAGRGIDKSPLVAERAAKSISAEHTFPTDTNDRRLLWKVLRGQAEEVGARLRDEGLLAGEVAIKLRYADWQTLTRQMKLAVPTDDEAALGAGAAALMRKHWESSRPVRLIGLRAGHLADAKTPAQLPLLP